MGTRYNSRFYKSKNLQKAPYESAKNIFPLLSSFLGNINSVVDLGCGTGAWLAAFKDVGVQSVQGIDGSYVDKSCLLINENEFMPYDLTKPINLDRKFDLAMSLEVAEHISSEYSEIFIGSLCSHSDAILFSAAVPGQGGVHHVNEQYPSYWCKLFEKKGYFPLDIIRRRIWETEDIAWFYRQNTFLFVKKDSPLYEKYHNENIGPFDIIHPVVYERAVHSSSLNNLFHIQLYIFRKVPVLLLNLLKTKCKSWFAKFTFSK